MEIFLCGVYKGTITGQMQTLFAVKDSLKDDFNITEIKLPRKPSKNKILLNGYQVYQAKENINIAANKSDRATCKLVPKNNPTRPILKITADSFGFSGL